MSRSSIALSNLRGAVIVIVLAFHSVLAYLAYQPSTPGAFDSPPYRWQAIPIVDSHPWFGFDLFCAWQDVSLMSLMFFLSGLFVPASLARKGSRTYLSDRLQRIGVPLALVVAFLMPVTYYPAYRVIASDPSVTAFWEHWLALPFWPTGPQWFLWQLLALSALAAGLFGHAPRWHERFRRLAAVAHDHPVRFFAILVAASAVVYVPLAAAFTPWSWVNYGPFSFQICRPLHYVVYFFAGYIVGAHGLDRGLVSVDGALARRWRVWFAASIAGFVLWAIPTSQLLDGHQAALPIRIASGLGFAVACGAGSFCFLGLCLRFAAERHRMLGSLSANAYGMYLVHYVFVVWMQYALLPSAMPAIVKAILVFGVTLALSWAVAAWLGNLSLAGVSVRVRRWAGASLGAGPAKLIKQDDLT